MLGVHKYFKILIHLLCRLKLGLNTPTIKKIIPFQLKEKMAGQVASNTLWSTSPSFTDRSGNGVKDDIKMTDERFQMFCPRGVQEPILVMYFYCFKIIKMLQNMEKALM